jgi:hypothetical protein
MGPSDALARIGGVRGRGELLLLVGLLVGGLGGYALGARTDDRAAGARSDPEHLRACPASSWARGGGYDYAAAGISCRDANRFVRVGRRFQAGTQEGRAFRFGPWVCCQTGTTDRTGRPAILNVGANGESRLRFLAPG